MDSTPLINAQGLNYFYGDGALRRQVLFDISTEVHAGEIVILTGPSGSGKTTLLALMGALRSVQDGQLQILGQELQGASEGERRFVRRNIGYIFQSHNLLDALTALQNVERGLALHRNIPERRARCLEALRAVGLAEHAHDYPRQLSGGQKQRVAIARALVSQPKIVLADEPTASLDKRAGREVVEVMQTLTRQQHCAVLLVTHDHRILDVADRIVHLDDGRISSFTDAVLSNTRHMFKMLAQSNRVGELGKRVATLAPEEFAGLLEQVTAEFHQFLELAAIANDEAFDVMLQQVLEAFTLKIGQILDAERATLFLVDRDRGELWSKVAQGAEENGSELRVPLNHGIAGRVATTGRPMNIADAYEEPLFNRTVDEQTGYRTRSILCVPITDERRQIFAVAQLLNKRGAASFPAADEHRFQQFASSIGVILETWWRMSQQRRPAIIG